MEIMLNEDVFDDLDDVEISEEPFRTEIPTPNPPTEDNIGVSGLILDAMTNCADAIERYNVMLANMGDREDLRVVLTDIANTENETMGKLQAMLKQVSPNAESIDSGSADAEMMMDPGSPVDESLSTDNIRAISESLDNFMGFKFNDDIDTDYKNFPNYNKADVETVEKPKANHYSSNLVDKKDGKIIVKGCELNGREAIKLANQLKSIARDISLETGENLGESMKIIENKTKKPVNELFGLSRAEKRTSRHGFRDIETESIRDLNDIDFDDIDEEMNEGIFGDYHDYDTKDGWSEDDINLHKSIDWKSRNYDDYDTGEEIDGTATLYGRGEPIQKPVKFHKFLRSNPIFPPYYRAVEDKPFDGSYVGPMYDGDDNNGYGIHNRYETQELYDRLSESNGDAIDEYLDSEFIHKYLD